jgi:hypothetical protein
MNVKRSLLPDDAALQRSGFPRTSLGIRSIVTHRVLDATLQRAWSSLLFYEDIVQRPPFLLRLLLPRPLQTRTVAQAIGDETTLQYADGQYTKRVTLLEPPRRYEFEVIEQRLSSDRGVKLLSGVFDLRELPASQIDLSITTRYTSRIRPRWLAEPVEAMLCRRLHRHVLDAIQAKAAAPPL